VDIVDCIKTVSEGKKYVGPSLQEYFARYLEADKKKSNVSEQLKSLTQAELKTLKLVNQSRSSKEIAELLFVSVKTVENYRSRICKKLGLDSRNNSLLLWVMENKDVLSAMREF
jgi:DNA-binding NarL/FixJ family response regulator